MTSKKAVSSNASRKPGTFAPSQFVRPGLNEDEVVEIKEAFDLFDTDGGGYIDPKGNQPLTQS